MPLPQVIDFLTPFDPSGYVTISGAQLEQLVGGLAPNLSIGLFLITTDIVGVPTVPNATTTTKWQAYGWLRITPQNNGVALYIWNPNGAVDATLLQWQVANIGSIPNGTITGSMIAGLTITDANMFSVSWSKIIPGGSGPSVGGVLTGNMPNPGFVNSSVGQAAIAALSVTGAASAGVTTATMAIQANSINDSNIQLQGIAAASIKLGTIVGGDGVTTGQIALETIDIRNLKGSGTASQMQIVDPADLTQMNWITPPLLLVSSGALETPIATSKFMPLTVNSAGTGYAYKPHDVISQYIEGNSANFATATTLVAGTLPTTANTVLATNFGAAGTITYTVVSASSHLMIEADISLGNTTATDGCHLALFQGATLIGHSTLYPAQNCTPQGVTTRLTAYIASPGAGNITFFIYIAAITGGSAQINIEAHQASTFRITEIL